MKWIVGVSLLLPVAVAGRVQAMEAVVQRPTGAASAQALVDSTRFEALSKQLQRISSKMDAMELRLRTVDLMLSCARNNPAKLWNGRACVAPGEVSAEAAVPLNPRSRGPRERSPASCEVVTETVDGNVLTHKKCTSVQR